MSHTEFEHDPVLTLVDDLMEATPWWSLPDSHMRFVSRYLHHGFRDDALFDLALSHVPEIIPADCTPQELHACAVHHDIGKPYVTEGDETLWDREILEEADRVKIRKHPQWGLFLVGSGAKQLGIQLPMSALSIIRWHHERLDGSGYPDSLMGSDIPLHVQLFSVVDFAVSLREDGKIRPYRNGRKSYQDVATYLTQLAEVGKLNGEYVDLVLGILRHNEHLKKTSLWSLGPWTE